MTVEVNFLHIWISRHALGNRFTYPLGIDCFNRNHKPFAISIDRSDVVTDNRHAFTEACHEIFFNVDLRPVRIFFKRSNDIIKNTFFTNNIVDKRFGRCKRCLDIPLHCRPTCKFARCPLWRIDGVAVRKMQHARCTVKAIGGKRLPPFKGRCVHHRPITNLVRTIIKKNDATSALYGIESLTAQNGNVVGALAFFA